MKIPCDLARLQVSELLLLHSEIGRELRAREIVRTSNNPTGELAERLFQRAFGWQLQSNSNAAFDALDCEGIRYQIKSRRITPRNPSRQLGSIRKLPDGDFDVLAAVIFDEQYLVERAILMPHALIEPRCRYSQHVNGWIMRLEDTCWSLNGVRDVTAELRRALNELG